jgi:formate hydrogenlyase transcriptional activator
MESQRDNRVSSSLPGHLPLESAQDFRRFTRQLNQCQSAAQLLHALPSTLRSFIAAGTFLVVVDIDDANPAANFVLNGNGQGSFAYPDFSSHRASASLWVHEQQKPLLLPSIAGETRFPDTREWFGSSGDQSLCILPLSTALRRLGVICVGRSSENAFSDEDVSLLALAADHAALALDDRLNFAASEKARLQLESEQTKLKLILDLNNSVVSNLELKQLIQAISPSIRNVMQIDAVALMLPSVDRASLEVYALDFPDSKGLIRPGRMVTPQGHLARVFRTGRPWVGDISEEEPQDYREGDVVLQEGFKALCLLPLVRCGRILGVLSVARLRKDSFTQQDVEFLLQIAGQVAIAIDNALAYRQISELTDKLSQEKLYFEDEIRSELNFEEIVGNSAVLKRVLRQVEAVAPTDSTVLIYGETGSGKELIARAVHKLSQRSSHSFVKLNCAAIPTGLLESELFGHEKGAFTGAIAQRIGRFELASDGTIFLDEVGEIPLELQPKLLRVLQEREFERLGSSRTLHTDARLIAATNRDLTAMVDSQKFRSDLFYRLNVFPIYVPPLRERTEDIPFLVRHFAQHFARLMKRQIDTISSETMNAIVRYPWPGNIRELQNVIERAVILSSGKELKVPITDLKPKTGENGSSNGVMTLEEMERRHILYVLEQTNWVFSGPNGAAARLGMKRPTLQFRMRKLGISRPSRS